MAQIFDVLGSMLRGLLELIGFFVDKTLGAGISVDMEIIGLIVVVLTIWLWSGAWASSIAAARRHGPVLHFLIGLVLPWLYPVFILFAMDVKGARQREHQQALQRAAGDQEAAAAPRRKTPEEIEAEEQAELEAGPDEAETAEESTFDMDYFKEIALDDEGNPTGPWLIEYGGNEVTALRIMEAMPNVVVIEMAAASGKTQRIRIPYSKITGCEPT